MQFCVLISFCVKSVKGRSAIYLDNISGRRFSDILIATLESVKVNTLVFGHVLIILKGILCKLYIICVIFDILNVEWCCDTRFHSPYCKIWMSSVLAFLKPFRQADSNAAANGSIKLLIRRIVDYITSQRLV